MSSHFEAKTLSLLLGKNRRRRQKGVGGRMGLDCCYPANSILTTRCHWGAGCHCVFFGGKRWMGLQQEKLGGDSRERWWGWKDTEELILKGRGSKEKLSNMMRMRWASMRRRRWYDERSKMRRRRRDDERRWWEGRAKQEKRWWEMSDEKEEKRWWDLQKPSHLGLSYQRVLTAGIHHRHLGLTGGGKMGMRVSGSILRYREDAQDSCI